MLTPEQVTELTDEQLYECCRRFGSNALIWRRKFIGLLPEANRRRLYQKKRFSSIFEFAFMLGGVSSTQVSLAVSLDRCFEDKPVLRRYLIRGVVSINKLARIVSVVTKENQEFWAKQVTLLSHRALETLVRDHRIANKQQEENKIGPLFAYTMGAETNKIDVHAIDHDEATRPTSQGNVGLGGAGSKSNLDIHPQPISELANQYFSLQNNNHYQKIDHQNGFHKPQNGNQFLHVQKFQPDSNILKLQLSPLAIAKLLELQNKGIDINRIILELIERRETNIAQTKQQLSATLPPATSRYIPAVVKKVVAAEHGRKCSIKTCGKPAAVLHHTQRFALARTHDPQYLAPLCEAHHKIAHTIDVKFQQAHQRAQQQVQQPANQNAQAP